MPSLSSRPLNGQCSTSADCDVTGGLSVKTPLLPPSSPHPEMGHLSQHACYLSPSVQLYPPMTILNTAAQVILPGGQSSAGGIPQDTDKLTPAPSQGPVGPGKAALIYVCHRCLLSSSRFHFCELTYSDHLADRDSFTHKPSQERETWNRDRFTDLENILMVIKGERVGRDKLGVWD